MKKVQRISALLLSLLLLLSISVFASDLGAGEMTMPGQAHVFPVQPGTEEWNSMSPAARRASCRVPAEEIAAMDTPALLETFLRYPYNVDIFCFNTLEMGIEFVADHVPVLAEFLSRQDAPMTLLLFSNEVNQARYANASTASERVSGYCLEALSDYLGTSRLTLGEAAVPLASVTTVTTPEGTSVEVFSGLTWSDHGLTATRAADQCEQILLDYPSTELLRDSSPKYNCHSYAWYSTSSSNPYWMNDPSAYMDDGSYSPGLPVRNAKMTYTYRGEIIHSAIVAANASSVAGSSVKSKWGALGLFSHDAMDCPYVDEYSGVSVKCWEM